MNIRRIAESEADIKFVASPGPGGQNVNKLATKAVLRWQLHDSLQLSEAQKSRLRENALLKNRLNSNGEIILSESRSRSQSRNRELVMQKLCDLLEQALRTRRPRKQTKPPKRAKEERLKNKRVRAERKRLRGKADI